MSIRWLVDDLVRNETKAMRQKVIVGCVIGGVSGNPRKFRHSALWNFLGGWSAA